MKFIAIKTDDGTIKGKLAFYCRMLHVSRQGFYKYLSVKDRPWKYQTLADTMLEIHAEDVCNDTYGRVRMFQALTLKQPDGIPIPSERTVYRVMEKIGLSHRPKCNPKGIMKADREARKSNDLLKRNFTSEKPLEKCVTDITEIKAKDGKLYVSAIFDCFDSAVLGLAMETTMDDCINKSIKELGLSYSKNDKQSAILSDVISKPKWIHDESGEVHTAIKKLVPDIITINGNILSIYDAKYYKIKLDKSQVM